MLTTFLPSFKLITCCKACCDGNVEVGKETKDIKQKPSSDELGGFFVW